MLASAYDLSLPYRGNRSTLSQKFQVELRLASTYTESKAAVLNDVLEEFFFDDGTLWEAAPLPPGVRDVTYELLATMVRAACSHVENVTLCEVRAPCSSLMAYT